MPSRLRARPSLALVAVLLPLVVTAAVACSDEPLAEPVDLVPAGDGGTQSADVTKPTDDAGDGAPAVKTAPYHLIGRFDGSAAAGPRLSWSGTQVRARFKGTGLAMRLKDSGNGFGGGSTRYAVVVDGAAPTDVAVTPAEESYALASGLPDAEHDVEITKLTEPSVGTSQLLELVVTGGALVPTPVPAPTRRLEFVGDSITAGYGILGPNGDCGFSAATESEAAAWGAVAAKALGAERSVLAWSGIGVFRDNGGGTVEQMPERYDRAIATEPASAWTHTSFAPDAVVVNLGTNDFASGDPGVAFETAYVAFLTKLRTTHPNAYLVVATSPMLTDSFPAPPANEQRRTKSIAALNRIVEARKTAGDAKIGLLSIDEQLASDAYGCDYHPSAATAQKMAARLTEFLKSTLGW